MMIVLEGADGVGKTTLAGLLANIMDAEILHETKPRPFAHYYQVIQQAKYRNIIADRFFWGQFVYQEPKERCLSLKQLRDLEREIVETNSKFIYVTAPSPIIQRRLETRNEKLSLPLETLLREYTWLVLTARCSIIEYDTFTGEVKYHDKRF